MNIKPLLDRVVVKMVEAEETTKSGHHSRCVLPRKNHRSQRLLQLVLGGFVYGHDEKMVVTVGQKVLLSKYAGTQVKVDGEEYTILRQSDILAIVE